MINEIKNDRLFGCLEIASRRPPIFSRCNKQGKFPWKAMSRTPNKICHQDYVSAIRVWTSRMAGNFTFRRAKCRRFISSSAAIDESRRSEEHTSELQSLMRITYAVFCLIKKKKQKQTNRTNQDSKNN